MTEYTPTTLQPMVLYMILYTENPKDATIKLLELIDEFGKFLQVNNTQKYVAFLDSHNKREELK